MLVSDGLLIGEGELGREDEGVDVVPVPVRCSDSVFGVGPVLNIEGEGFRLGRAWIGSI